MPGVRDGDDHQVGRAGDVDVRPALHRDLDARRRPRPPARRPRRPPRRRGRRPGSPAGSADPRRPAARPGRGPADRCRRAPRRPVPPPRARPSCAPSPARTARRHAPIMPGAGTGGQPVEGQSPSQARSSAVSFCSRSATDCTACSASSRVSYGPSRCRSAQPSRLDGVVLETEEPGSLRPCAASSIGRRRAPSPSAPAFHRPARACAQASTITWSCRA